MNPQIHAATLHRWDHPTRSEPKSPVFSSLIGSARKRRRMLLGSPTSSSKSSRCAISYTITKIITIVSKYVNNSVILVLKYDPNLVKLTSARRPSAPFRCRFCATSCCVSACFSCFFDDGCQSPAMDGVLSKLRNNAVFCIAVTASSVPLSRVPPNIVYKS